MTTSEEIVEAYDGLELWLMGAIGAAVAGATVKGVLDARRLAAARAEVLAGLNLRLKRLEATTTKQVTALVEDTAQAAFDEAITLAKEAGFTPTTEPRPVTPPVARPTMEKLHGQHLMVRRQTDDVFRWVIRAAMRAQRAERLTEQQAIERALSSFAERGVRVFTDGVGREWSIHAYTDMAVRTGMTQARNEAHVQGYQTAGVQLVRASWHPASAPQCAPYQNQLLSLDGSRGDVEVIDRITGEPTTVHVKDTLTAAIAAGYHHPNCRHRDTPYVPGTATPKHPTQEPETTQQEYAALQRQRTIERHIRRWKREAAIAPTEAGKQRAVARVRMWQREQARHVREHRFLSRELARERAR